MRTQVTARVLIIVCVAIMLAALSSAAALAAEHEVNDAAGLQSVLEAVYDGDTIKLLADIDYPGGIVITGKTVTFDLNGHNLNVTNNAGHGLEAGSGGVVNLDTSNGGSFNVTASGSGSCAVYAHDGGQVTVTSATASGSRSCAVYADGGGQAIVTRPH